VEVSCKIIDVDDHPTFCQDYNFETTLQENSVVDTSVVAFTCTDEDDWATNPITYTIKDVGIDPNATLADQYFHFGDSGTSNIMKTKQQLNLEGGTLVRDFYF
jgi:hypothetical protein